MRKKYCSKEEVFKFIWDNCDHDGMWSGDIASIAAKFHVSEDTAHAVLGELSDLKLIERVYPNVYAITKWLDPESDDEEDQPEAHG
jgi:hypothetical protein